METFQFSPGTPTLTAVDVQLFHLQSDILISTYCVTGQIVLTCSQTSLFLLIVLQVRLCSHDCNILFSAITPLCAFTAVMGSGGDRSYSPNAIVQFPVVITNIGGAYDKNTGIFQCPHKGIYLITVSVLSQSNQIGLVHIMKNGRKLVSTWAHGRQGSHGHSTNLVVVECVVGEKIWIQAYPDPTVHETTVKAETPRAQSAQHMGGARHRAEFNECLTSLWDAAHSAKRGARSVQVESRQVELRIS